MNSMQLALSVLAVSQVASAAACSKKEKAESAPGIPLGELWIESSRTTFVDHVQWGQGEVETRPSSEEKVAPEAGLAAKCSGKALARENVEDPGGSDEFISITYSCLDDAGIGHYAMVIPEQRSTELYELKYELLNPVRMGQAWSGSHQVEGASATRSCQVRESRYCQQGAATVCVTESAGGSLSWLRQHYCQGQGWRGYEAVSVRAGAIAMRSWSSKVVTDDLARADVGDPSDLPTVEGIVADAAAIKAAAAK